MLDQLLACQPSIQKKLVEKHLTDGCLVLYDLTNIWLEGDYIDSELAAYGRGKGGKTDYKQIAIGLIANREGCPVAVRCSAATPAIKVPFGDWLKSSPRPMESKKSFWLSSASSPTICSGTHSNASNHSLNRTEPTINVAGQCLS